MVLAGTDDCFGYQMNEYIIMKEALRRIKPLNSSIRGSTTA